MIINIEGRENFIFSSPFWSKGSKMIHIVFEDILEILDSLRKASPVGKMLSHLLQGLLKGRLEYYPQWEDLRAPATAINPPGAVSDPDIDSDDGAFLFDSTGIEQVPVIFQMPHDWKQESIIHPHAHWVKTSDATGEVIWQYRYKVWNIDEIAPSWSSWITADGRSQEPGATQVTVVEDFPEIDMTGFKISCMVSFQFRRDPTNENDDYGADAKLWEFDLHYLRNSFGSNLESVKDSIGDQF